MEWALLPLKRFSQVSGRSRRKEYWSFFLFMMVVYLVAGMLDGLLGMSGFFGGYYGPVALLAMLAFVIPSFTAGIRRLHDTGRSGWWILTGFVPFVGWLVLLYFFILEGDRGANAFGEDPKAGEAVPARPA